MSGDSQKQGASAGRALIGLALLGGVAFVGYIVYKWYKQKQALDKPVMPVRITVPIQATTKKKA